MRFTRIRVAIRGDLKSEPFGDVGGDLYVQELMSIRG